jgi:L-arabinokinase
VTSVVFYISGHGFGHASREVEVINALGGALARPSASREGGPSPGVDDPPGVGETSGSETRIIIRSSVSPWLLSRTLNVPYELRPGACDTGIVQVNSVTHDDPRTIADAATFYANLPARADEEARVLATDAVGAIVGDIPPLAFEVAARLGVPSVGIANFLWDWIYEGYPDLLATAPLVLPAIRAAYGRATLGLRLPFAGDFSSIPRVVDIPLIARHATRSRADTRAHCGLPPDRPVALLSFGGYGLPVLDWPAIDCLGEWTIAVADRSVDAGMVGAHVHAIDERAFDDTGFRYEDLVAAADVVVTKPGFGIVAECIAAGTAMVYTSRGRFREYDVFVEEMPRYLRARFLSHADLFGGRWRAALDGVLRQPPPPGRLDTNGAEVAAAAIKGFLTIGHT